MTSALKIRQLDPEIVLPKCSLAEWILTLFRRYSAEGRIAQTFADDGTSWSYEELLQSSVRVAAGLKELGIQSGDWVSFVTRNCHELYAIVIACVLADVTVIGSTPELPPDSLREQLRIVRSKFVIAGETFIPKVEQTVNKAVPTLDPRPKILEIKKLFRDAVAKGSHSDPVTYKPAKIKDPNSHVFTCMFSSGTTGTQKAVTIADTPFIYNVYCSSTYRKQINGPTINGSQFQWVSWWFSFMRGVFWGWNRIIMDKNDPIAVLDAVHKYKPVLWNGPSGPLASMANIINENPGRWDLSSIKIFTLAGDIVSKTAHEQFAEQFNAAIYQAYGLTEVGLIAICNADEPIVFGSVGRPYVPIKIVDPITRKEITEPNKPGEIICKETTMRGYVNNPEATADAFDGNGWFKTGDIAYFNVDGNVFIVDRVKEMFKYRNYQIAPSQLEGIIKKIPGVKETAVVGKNAGVLDGCLPTAFVVKAQASSISEKDILDFLEKENLHDSMKLRGGVIFTDEIPKTSNGKISRAKLRELVNSS